MPALPQINGLLFDLDGTLVDTAPDLIEALYRALSQFKLPCLADEHYLTSVASHGSLGLVKAAQPDLDAEHTESVRLALLEHYLSVNGDCARVFDGIDLLLDFALQHRIKLGVVTNKPARFTRPLLTKLGLTPLMKSIISADSTLYRKPDIQPMRLAASQLVLNPAEIAYLGDAERDIIAARNVQMPSVLAGWGYLAEHDTPERWGADLTLNSPTDLLAFIDR
ncbi:HAD-IA family hydrolase [Shewanella avicenniae]|uniref:HAD-IA family hydrolase n=1 Tax=Shewanella avicenniae TaxID=2814294 RepID=A0ABX7QX49_9GAMM|nr:HAD-IA family hydrolase [Shewanella avicenniae]QSX35213.1 HAD-IA family hydrolase [Shewanella avicenniae]